MVTPSVSTGSKVKLGKRAKVVEVEPIASPAEAKGTSWEGSGYTKLRLWDLAYDTVVYVDSDAVVLENIDDLFDLDVPLAAAPDIFPPDKFNAGVLVLRPSQEIFQKMLLAVPKLTSHDKGDTGFLNSFFPDWYTGPSASRLPFRYNAQRTLYWMTHDREPGYWNTVKPIKILHFSSSPKPWQSTNKKGHLDLIWWHHFLSCQQSDDSPLADLGGLASFLG